MIAQRLVATSAVAARFAPRLTYTAIDGVAAATHGAPHGVRPEDLAAVFPHLTPDELSAAARQARATVLRNKTLVAMIDRFGMAPLRPRLRLAPALTALEPPAILATFHLGPLHAVGAALELLRGDVRVLRRDADRSPPRPTVTASETSGDRQQRALAFLSGLSELRRGGFVMLSLDPAHASRVAAPLFGRQLAMARGAFALARLSGAPVVPVAARWVGSDVVIECGAPVAAHADAERMAAAVTAWLEHYLGRHPEQLGRRTIDLLS